MKVQRGSRDTAVLFFNLGTLDAGGETMSHPCCGTPPWKEIRYTLYRRLVWIDVENLAPPPLGYSIPRLPSP